MASHDETFPLNNNSPRIVVARYREDMARMLAEVIETTRKLEQRMAITGGWRKASAELDLESDPSATLRFQGALLLRKARVHSLAVLRANETNNLHSLAVQMRPVLECAGQVLFIIHYTILAPGVQISPENAAMTYGNRLNADFYQSFRKLTRGQINREELRKMATQAQVDAATSFEAVKPKQQKSWKFNQADKVANLAKGDAWYAFLSDHFIHGKSANLKGFSWQGGVMSIDQVEDEFAFLGLMSYLVEQVALMNAAAALCPAQEESRTINGTSG